VTAHDQGLDVPGVRAIAHTADVALEIEGTTPEAVFDRAARGLHWLVFERRPRSDDASHARPFSTTAPDRSMLLRAWLRHLLQLYDDEGLGYRSAEFVRLSDTELEARIACHPVADEPVREIKGVTLHDLRVEKHEDGWRARVVFDV
jgi:SHS2 domain-containing protein